MEAGDLSQVVVRRDGDLTLLTAEGVSAWLRERTWDMSVNVRTARIADALERDVPSNSKVMSADRTVGDALAAFANAMRDGRPRLYAIIVTQHGRPTEEPLGIVTPWDLIAVERVVGKDKGA